MTLTAILVHGIAQTQTQPIDWSWTFQRWGSTCGLLFEDAALGALAKAAIMGKIANAYKIPRQAPGPADRRTAIKKRKESTP